MKKNIALLTGGYTKENIISLKSAIIVEQNIDKNKYNIYKIFIYFEEWYYIDQNNKKFFINRNDFSLKLPEGKIRFDGVFNVIHGSPGEDGKLASYFDMIQIPYNTSDVVTSAITINKAYTKSILQDIPELNIAKSIQFIGYNSDYKEEILSQLLFPCIIKPNTCGSSIGISKVNQIKNFDIALKKAFQQDNQVLVEEWVEGREFSVGIYKVNGKLKILPITEIICPNEFFDFDAKYSVGVAKEITPAKLSEKEVLMVNKIAEAIYKKLNCKGIIRIDFFLEKNTGKFYFIEINTVPGQTDTSIITQQVEAVDMNLSKFYDELIEEMWNN